MKLLKKLLLFALGVVLLLPFYNYLADKYGLWNHLMPDDEKIIQQQAVTTIGKDAKAEMGFARDDHSVGGTDEQFLQHAGEQVLRVRKAKAFFGELGQPATTPVSMATPTLATPSQPVFTKLETFRVEKLDDAAWHVQLDARLPWPDTGIYVRGGDVVEFIADEDSVACPGPPDPCAGPNGQMGLAKYSRFQPEQFPVGDAMFQALVARIGNRPGFQVGQYLKYKVPPDVSGTVQPTENIRLPWRHTASGGHRSIIRVTRGR